MQRRQWFAPLAICASLGLAAACGTDDRPEPTGLEIATDANGVSARATGGGEFLVTIGEGFPGKFAFNAIQRDPSGAAVGNLRYSLVFFGELLEFHGRVTCMTVDPANNRAWIGGVVTKNNSTHPNWMQDINEPGRDIWFRVVDHGEGGSAEADRTTFVGFEGNRGIITSEEYCEAQFWDEESAPWAVTKGNIQVRDR